VNARAEPAATAATPPAGWQFDRARWPQALALRHRALLATDDAGQRWLLADRDADPLLLQAAEARLALALRWQRCDSALLDAALAAGEHDGRALDLLTTPDATAATDGGTADGPELSLGRMGDAADGPAVQLLDAVLLDALADGASDIHLETQPRGALVRLRLDGVMQTMRRIDGQALAEQIVSRLKVMAELDIGERRLPQDGRFQLRVRGRAVDFRLSIMPSVHGEDAVLRVLDRSTLSSDGGALTLTALGLPAALRTQIEAQARRPHGMLLVTGPTGSGKTTTLYAAISALPTAAEKVITIEDPVEYRLPGVVQIPVNDAKGLGFARGLRSILRHDPDRVMVGEIRDGETAQIAVQAALTGHLVFSTVHANSAFDVIGRFMHLGLDLYNLVAALNAVLAQRLMRQVCPQCAQPVAASAAELQRLGAHAHGATLRRGAGCPHCRGTGYRGRQAVAELLVFDDTLRDLVAERAPMSAIRRAAAQAGMAPLREAALAAVAAGATTLDEFDRVIADG
jgi:general secretion pathway protein E